MGQQTNKRLSLGKVTNGLFWLVDDDVPEKDVDGIEDSQRHHQLVEPSLNLQGVHYIVSNLHAFYN